MGSPVGAAVLRCPRCHAHFDVVHAGACVDENADATVHLDPIPLLVRDGVLSIAVAAKHTEAGMA
jgi:nitrite reductase/ring-hydroxylating ferredoxin subunit